LENTNASLVYSSFNISIFDASIEENELLINHDFVVVTLRLNVCSDSFIVILIRVSSPNYIAITMLDLLGFPSLHFLSRGEKKLPFLFVFFEIRRVSA
jgi:hypothetical protein